jgi:hypothetical protein
VKASAVRSPELARWLALHGLRDCICTYLPEGKAGWCLYRVLDGCPRDHPDAPPPPPEETDAMWRARRLRGG